MNVFMTYFKVDNDAIIYKDYAQIRSSLILCFSNNAIFPPDAEQKWQIYAYCFLSFMKS